AHTDCRRCRIRRRRARGDVRPDTARGTRRSAADTSPGLAAGLHYSDATSAPDRLWTLIERSKGGLVPRGSPRIDVDEQHVLMLKAAIERSEVIECPCEQPGTYQERQRDRHLGGDKQTRDAASRMDQPRR